MISIMSIHHSNHLQLNFPFISWHQGLCLMNIYCLLGLIQRYRNQHLSAKVSIIKLRIHTKIKTSQSRHFLTLNMCSYYIHRKKCHRLYNPNLLHDCIIYNTARHLLSAITGTLIISLIM